MTVTFTLNGKQVTIDTIPGKRLADVLKEDFALPATRPGCYAGVCGTCAVIVNGELAHSCLIPAFAIQDAEVLTGEGLEGTREFDEILSGFEHAGYRPCANCRQSKLLTAYVLLTLNPNPERANIDEWFADQKCSCSSLTDIYKAIDYIVLHRRSASRGRK